MVSNKELQEKRMRGYFIDAAKETLKGEGLKAVNVRTVAERAGYSFATMYNYFKDLNELIFICVKDFMSECEAFADEQSDQQTPGSVRLRVRIRAMIQYFTQYPGIFELFYLERMNDIGARQPTAEMIYLFTDRIIQNDIEQMISSGEISAQDAEMLKISLRNGVAGMLVFYNNRLQPVDYRKFMETTENQLDFLIQRIYPGNFKKK
ncbi:transcriptional regulator, TetR family [Lentimicrobium saccharophilum]|uniref:Transcriptional regulator, TetR family n=1 Tax=Lentimicrobium saccharophilum TaxID=1678841 RepID=A0A0S7BW66_9BACT|nr:TetR/AcrR family transcriptional regulator [Lentimicrobium saccharophilum]GAP44813.1 transcriptional regulator, TetR family [Lentimicrobium saccharophilum]